MRMPSSLKLVIATWIAALVGALAGRSLAEVSGAAPRNDTIAQSTPSSMGSLAHEARATMRPGPSRVSTTVASQFEAR